MTAAASSTTALPDRQVFAGEIRAASFLGLSEEYIVAVNDMELRVIQPSSEVQSGDSVEVSVRPEDCIVFLAPTNR
jgi:hypothetical protein